MALASVGLGWWVAGRALRPLRRMTATARSLSEASLHERIALDGPSDEMRELAETFDAMLDRLEAAFESQRSFVANASHELRTPLSIQRALLDVALDDPHAPASELREAARQVLAVTARSEHLIENLLVLARSTRRSEEHTSELQSRRDLVCRLLLEKKKKKHKTKAKLKEKKQNSQK